MALISCPECARQISDKAIVCVGCGVPLKAEGSRWTFGKVAGTWVLASTADTLIRGVVFIVAAAVVAVVALLVSGRHG
ncbi:hypothetical protein [Reyranella sp. CPCC 100927]|uniref:hypothetical protein n=1 Tax=Reyranella sp. CPCC 100927 TaxID=2599616 RepID=UPI0011B6C2D5|nr:hypothetical protein [Reyranella sp. CPCC 100927]TWT05034.1 hypothetical protein FQU96_25620 [Reyranella sp. CPCC 100927]